MTGSHRAARSVYVYSDETGQQSRGAWLVVAAVVITEHRKQIERELEDIERRSGKELDDWHCCKPKHLRRYLDAALSIDGLASAVHFRVYERIRPADYLGRSIETVLDSADVFDPVSVVFIPEGFPRRSRERLESEARERFDRAEVWSGKFRGCSLVRFADAVAGLIGQDRFKKGSPKHFPDLVNPFFVELDKRNPPAVCR